MTTIKTNWLAAYYDPLNPPPEPKEEITNHHLVYAAMLDGVRGKDALEDYTGICSNTVSKLQRDLAKEGYIRMGRCNSRKCYVLYEEPNTYVAAIAQETVNEIRVLARTRGYTQNDLANHFKAPKWAIADAMQGRKQYSESRV